MPLVKTETPSVLDIISKLLAEWFGCPCNYSPIDEWMAYVCQDDCRMDNDQACWKKTLEIFIEKEINNHES